MSLKLGSESEPESCKFAFNKAQSTLLKLEGTVGLFCACFFPLKLFFLQVRGVHVQVEISDSSSIITFMPYFVGSSPVRVENRLREDIPVTVFQRLDHACHVVFRPNIGAQRRRKRRRLRQQRDQSNVYLVESERKARFLLEISFIFRASILQ